jgi:hypothetical protein
MKSMGKKPQRRRSFTPEFKAEIVELCQRGDRSVGQAHHGVANWVMCGEGRSLLLPADGADLETVRTCLEHSTIAVMGR